MHILNDLWYGNNIPAESPCQADGYSQLFQRLPQIKQTLTNQLSPEQQEQLEQYESAYDQMIHLQLADAFSKGFRLGAQIMLETLSSPS